MKQPNMVEKKDSGVDGASKKGRMRREELIDAARDLFEEKGIGRTSVLEITERVGVARSLYYHYFSDKSDITNAVLEAYAADFVEALQHWNKQRVPGQTEKSLRSILQIFRSFIFENNSFRLDLASTANASLYLQFTQRVANQVSKFIVEVAAEDYAKLYPVEIDNVYESVYVLVTGLISLIRSNPDIDQEIIVQISIQALHLKAGIDQKGS